MYLITNTLLYTYIQISYLQGRVEEEGGEGIRNGKRESGVERREGRSSRHLGIMRMNTSCGKQHIRIAVYQLTGCT